MEDQDPFAAIEFHINQLGTELSKGHRTWPLISPQLQRKLLHLIDFKARTSKDLRQFVIRLRAAFGRLIFELTQAHYNSKNREQMFVRLVKHKGCIITDPHLLDLVIDRLVNLYEAARMTENIGVSSFERNSLNRYLSKELAANYSAHYVERALQTLYWCDIFTLLRTANKPCRFELKKEFYDASKIRERLDEKMIKLARDHSIRLEPASFTFLLYGAAGDQAKVSKIQSILDKVEIPVTIRELETVIKSTNDKFSLQDVLPDMKFIEATCLRAEATNLDVQQVVDLVDKFVGLKGLFALRQTRGLRPEMSVGKNDARLKREKRQTGYI